MRNKCSLFSLYFCFSFVLILSSAFFVFDTYKRKGIWQNHDDSSILASVIAPDAKITEKQCGLVLVGVTKGIMEFQHRCAPVGKLYHCAVATVYTKPHQKRTYIDKGQTYFYSRTKKHKRPVKEFVCNTNPVIGRVKPKELKVAKRRDCGLVPNAKMQFSMQHQCASQGDKLLCKRKRIYFSSQMLGHYSPKLRDTYIHPAYEWVCKRPQVVAKEGKIEKIKRGIKKIAKKIKQIFTKEKEKEEILKKDRQCGLVASDFSSEYGEKLLHQCAPQGKGYHCQWKTVYSDAEPSSFYVEGGSPYYSKTFSKYTNPRENWVCQSQEIDFPVTKYPKKCKVEQNRECGLVPYDSKKDAKKPSGRQYRCAPKDFVYSLCKLDQVYYDPDKPGNYSVKKDDSYTVAAEEWVCNSSKVIQSPRKRQCGLIEGSSSDGILKHRCAKPGRGYLCRLKPIYSDQDHVSSRYVEGGSSYRDKKSLTYFVQREDWVCDPEEKTMAFKSFPSYGKRLEGNRLCGLIPYDAYQTFLKGHALQHQCAPPNYVYSSCKWEQVYYDPKTLGSYSSKKTLQHKEQVVEWVCDPKKRIKVPEMQSSTGEESRK